MLVPPSFFGDRFEKDGEIVVVGGCRSSQDVGQRCIGNGGEKEGVTRGVVDSGDYDDGSGVGVDRVGREVKHRRGDKGGRRRRGGGEGGGGGGRGGGRGESDCVDGGNGSNGVVGGSASPSASSNSSSDSSFGDSTRNGLLPCWETTSGSNWTSNQNKTSGSNWTNSIQDKTSGLAESKGKLMR